MEKGSDTGHETPKRLSGDKRGEVTHVHTTAYTRSPIKNVKLPDDRTPAEEASFKFFDGQRLQFTDRVVDGFYDTWGGFVGTEDNTPVTLFPRLEELSRIPVTPGDEREVTFIDRRIDSRLRELEQKATGIMADFATTKDPKQRVKELAGFVADCMGGACPHETLSLRYREAAGELKANRQSLTLPLGELTVGLGRQRALLLKILADATGLPCEVLRGEFYLGSAGHSGEMSVVILEVGGKEWMVELVTQPGRLFQVRKDVLSKEEAARTSLSNDEVWGRASGERLTDRHSAFPTLPRNRQSLQIERRGGSDGSESAPSSSDNSAGLHWNERDGPTMDELSNSGSEILSQPRTHTSMSSSSQPTPLAPMKEGQVGLGAKAPPPDARARSLDELRSARSPGAVAEKLSIRQSSLPLPPHGPPEPDEQQRHSVAAGEETRGMQDKVTDPTEMNARLAELDKAHAASSIEPQSSGSTTARVRGRDASGRMIEVELQGLTLTHAHNMVREGGSLDACLPVKKIADAPKAGRSLESIIGQYRYLGTHHDPRHSTQSLAPGESSAEATGEWKEIASGSEARSGRYPVKMSYDRMAAQPHRSSRNFPGLSSEELERGEAWERLMQQQQGHRSKRSLTGPASTSSPPISSGNSMVSITPRASEQRVHSLLDNAAVRESLHGSRGSQTTQTPSGLQTPVLQTSVSLPATEEAEVDFDEIELGPRIGIGCFGEVFKARWRQTTVAVKRLFAQSVSEKSIEEFKAEVLMNRRMKHPNVIMFMGACLQPPNLSIITQWIPRGSLFHLLHGDQPGRPQLNLRRKLKMALDIARGMHYLHSARPPVMHRDLKSMNLLVDNDLSIKVCDFGLARIRSSTWMTGSSQGGTPEWTAPEVLRSAQYNEKSDVYSYGVVLYELATEKEPWADMTSMQVVGAVGWAGNRLEPPPDCPPIFADLMLRCFAAADDRPSFDVIIQELLQYGQEHRERIPPKASK